jgi:plastocyanin
MNSKRLTMLSTTLAVLLTGLVLVVVAQEPTATPEAPTEEATRVFQGDVNDLLPCGAYEDMVTLYSPEPVTAAPSNTPDPNAATPTQAPPTNTPRPAPSEDRVGFPENYSTEFKLLFIFNRPDRRFLRIICGNDIASQRQPGEPFEYGSVLLMISRAAQIGENGQPVVDENGFYVGGNIVALHVQRKEPGFGAEYATDQTGEWEYMAYNADGSVQVASQNTNFCAVCHGGEAGESLDFVFRMDLFYEGEEALIAPPAGENEISIHLYAFHEPVLEITTGTTVTWVNNDEANHTVVAAVMDEAGRYMRAEEPLFESDILASVNIAAGDSFSFTFDEPGEYLYRCSIHENMTGRIVVTE